MTHIPKKSLGQNFLKNPAIVQKIVDAAHLTARDTVVEIGPGHGVLTDKLLAHAGHVIAIEKDDQLFAELSSLYHKEIASQQLLLLHGDILTFSPKTVLGDYKLVANIPYNITGAIIEEFLSDDHQPTDMVLMVQKEVADRIIAKNKKTGAAGKESILSLSVKVYGEPVYVTTVKAGNFFPAPKIDSAVIHIKNISRSNFKNRHHEEVFFQIMKAGFAHKRKTLAGNLKEILEPSLVEELLEKTGLSKTVRAEDIQREQWLLMTNIVYNDQYGS